MRELAIDSPKICFVFNQDLSGRRFWPISRGRFWIGSELADQDFAIRNCCTCWYAYMPEPLAKQARKSLKLAEAGQKFNEGLCGVGVVWCGVPLCIA